MPEKEKEWLRSHDRDPLPVLPKHIVAARSASTSAQAKKEGREGGGMKVDEFDDPFESAAPSVMGRKSKSSSSGIGKKRSRSSKGNTEQDDNDGDLELKKKKKKKSFWKGRNFWRGRKGGGGGKGKGKHSRGIVYQPGGGR
jgi:hypothetical protein